ncbi:MAG: flagellar filament capping protein FliD [Bacteroidetes bacterium]|nr:flagellar filament capping protein FliD [Bacteroidota bacterium]
MAVSGVSSSDMSSMLAGYRASISKPVFTLQTKRSSLQSRVTALSDLKTKLNALQATVSNLAKSGSESVINSFSVASTKESVVTASATAVAAEGSHTIMVSQVAKSDTLVTNRMTSNATTIVDSEGAGQKSFSLTVNGVTKNISIEISAGDTNKDVLTKIANAVTVSDAGVSASVVTDTATTSKLMFVSKETGASNAISLENISGTLLDELGLTAAVLSGRDQATATTAGFSYTAADSLNAKFNFDGIDFVKETNSVTDVLSGVTLNLKGSQSPTDSVITLTIAANTSGITEKIQEFIKNYNDVLTYLNQKTGIDPVTKSRQVLAGDTAITSLKYNLRNIVSSVVSSVTSGNPTILGAIGIDTARDGTLSLKDPDLLKQKLSSVKAVGDLFNSSEGIAVRMKSLLKSMLTYGSGQIELVTGNLKTQISSIDERITNYNKRIDQQVQRFQDQFSNLQAQYQQIMSQQNMIASIMSGMYYR